MEPAPVVLRMNVRDSKSAIKIRKAIENLRGVRRVSVSPEQGLVVVHGTADAWTLRRRIRSEMERTVEIVSDGSVPYYYYPGTTAAPVYGPPQLPAHAYYYSHQQPRAYYSQPSALGYPYVAGWNDHQDPYGTVPTCSIL